MVRSHHRAGEPLSSDFYVIASKSLIRGTGADARAGEFPRSAYWEVPDEPADSGWRVLVGDETQEDADQADDFQLNALETLRTFHPELKQIFVLGITGTWIWDDDHARYVEVGD